MLTLFPPAKLNLFFETFGLRSDGYHDVLTLTVPVSVYDHLEIESLSGSDSAVFLSCFDSCGADLSSSIPTDGRNLVVKAVKALSRVTGISRSLSIKLTKGIPSEAGMGGGSSDAASLLSGLNQLWKLDLSKKELQEIGAQLGSDVPLFFEDGYALGRGRGEITEQISGLPELQFLIFKPVFGLSTAAVYAASREVPDSERRSPDSLIDAVRSGEIDLIQSLFFNRLEEAARRISPELDQIMTRFSEFASFSLTGSGTAFYSLLPDRQTGERLAEQIQETGVFGNCYLCHSL